VYRLFRIRIRLLSVPFQGLRPSLKMPLITLV
jgi:hypothetical protein